MSIKMQLDPVSTLPRAPQYVHIRDSLAARIETGELIASAKLPSERELSESFNTTRVAAREALLALETEGLIYRLDRRGWFVSPPRVVYNPRSTKSFMQYVTAQGRIPTTELISAEQIGASEWAAKHLGINVGDPVYSIWRRRFIDGRPVMVEHIRMNAESFPDFLEIPLNNSITEAMSKFYSVELTRVKMNLYPSSLSASQARHLLVSPGTSGLYICRSNHDQHGKITDVDQEYWLHDVLEISLEAHKEQSE
ncbi:UTRA domain-containing protein [Aquirhabdus parva]|uniref:UTRA domain-containing protein n=2 Tax=Aquirhabdus parva TaxID=2283318 RepID=A0A345P5S9_9GAMM|nr:UTRA domain-containing protein [Aquirhabdus parva]